MTDLISEQIQREIKKLKFFAKRNQQEQKISHTESLNHTAEICFGIPSWSFVKNKFFSETYDDKRALLLRIGACNFALNSNHIGNLEYAFHYWIFMGKPSADTVLLNSSKQDLKIFETIFKSVAEAKNNICTDLKVSNNEKNDLLAFRNHALEFSFHVDFNNKSDRIEAAVFAGFEEADEIAALAEAEGEKAMEEYISKILDESIPLDADDEAAWAAEVNDRLKKIDEIMDSPTETFDIGKAIMDALNSPES